MAFTHVMHENEQRANPAPFFQTHSRAPRGCARCRIIMHTYAPHASNEAESGSMHTYGKSPQSPAQVSGQQSPPSQLHAAVFSPVVLSQIPSPSHDAAPAHVTNPKSSESGSLHAREDLEQDLPRQVERQQSPPSHAQASEL